MLYTNLNEKFEQHDSLNPALWDANGQLDSKVEEHLLNIVEQYVNDSNFLTLDDIITARIVGSNASFNYTNASDVDLHLLVDMDRLSKDPKFAQYANDGEKSLFNKRYDIELNGVAVEVYVEDINTSAVSNGVYDLFDKKWIKFPEKVDITVDSEKYEKYYSNYKDKATKLLREGNYEDITDFINKLYLMRSNSLAKDGEPGDDNQVFKDLRASGLFDKLKDRMNELKSKELSLKESAVTEKIFEKNSKYKIKKDRSDFGERAFIVKRDGKEFSDKEYAEVAEMLSEGGERFHFDISGKYFQLLPKNNIHFSSRYGAVNESDEGDSLIWREDIHDILNRVAEHLRDRKDIKVANIELDNWSGICAFIELTDGRELTACLDLDNVYSEAQLMRELEWDIHREIRALSENTMINRLNIREALNKIDNSTYNKFDLLNLYESIRLSATGKRKIAEMIGKRASAAAIQKVLIEDDEEDYIDTAYRDASEEELRKMGAFDNLDDEEYSDYYDAAHAEEWMERHPHGYYNSESDKGVEDDFEDIDFDETDFETGSDNYVYIKRKTVNDADGFSTDYTMYYDKLGDRYICIFGDEELYTPENSSPDVEFETREEADEWFNNYYGIEESLNKVKGKRLNEVRSSKDVKIAQAIDKIIRQFEEALKDVDVSKRGYDPLADRSMFDTDTEIEIDADIDNDSFWKKLGEAAEDKGISFSVEEDEGNGLYYLGLRRSKSGNSDGAKILDVLNSDQLWLALHNKIRHQAPWDYADSFDYATVLDQISEEVLKAFNIDINGPEWTDECADKLAAVLNDVITDYYGEIDEALNSRASLKEDSSYNDLFSIKTHENAVKYPNGVEVKEDSVDLDVALDYMFGTDRDPDNSTYTEDEKQRAINYWIEKTGGKPITENREGLKEAKNKKRGGPPEGEKRALQEFGLKDIGNGYWEKGDVEVNTNIRMVKIYNKETFYEREPYDSVGMLRKILKKYLKEAPSKKASIEESFETEDDWEPADRQVITATFDMTLDNTPMSAEDLIKQVLSDYELELKNYEVVKSLKNDQQVRAKITVKGKQGYVINLLQDDDRSERVIDKILKDAHRDDMNESIEEDIAWCKKVLREDGPDRHDAMSNFGKDWRKRVREELARLQKQKETKKADKKINENWWEHKEPAWPQEIDDLYSTFWEKHANNREIYQGFLDIFDSWEDNNVDEDVDVSWSKMPGDLQDEVVEYMKKYLKRDVHEAIYFDNGPDGLSYGDYMDRLHKEQTAQNYGWDTRHSNIGEARTYITSPSGKRFVIFGDGMRPYKLFTYNPRGYYDRGEHIKTFEEGIKIRDIIDFILQNKLD